MRLTFLGTGGSEGYPATFCECVRCERARALGGPNIRRGSSLLVNDDLLLDLGPDVPAAVQALGLSLHGLRWVVVTHAHDDHWQPVALKYRGAHYGAAGLPLLTVIGSAPSLERLREIGVPLADVSAATVEAIKGVWITAGSYRVLPLTARHSVRLDPRVYVVSDGSRSVLYATDTGSLPDEAWEQLGSSGVQLDAAVFDAMYWEESGDPSHLTLDGVIWHAAELRRSGLMGQDGLVLATHLSHRSQPEHAVVAERLAPHGVGVAHDGLVVEI